MDFFSKSGIHSIGNATTYAAQYFKKDNKFWAIRKANRTIAKQTNYYLEIISGRIGNESKYFLIDFQELEEQHWRNQSFSDRIQSKIDKGYIKITKKELEMLIKSAQKVLPTKTPIKTTKKLKPAVKKKGNSKQIKTVNPIMIAPKQKTNEASGKSNMNQDSQYSEIQQIQTIWGLVDTVIPTNVWRGECSSLSGGKFWEILAYTWEGEYHYRTRWGKLGSKGTVGTPTIYSSQVTRDQKFNILKQQKKAKGYKATNQTGAKLDFGAYLKDSNNKIPSKTEKKIEKKKSDNSRASIIEFD